MSIKRRIHTLKATILKSIPPYQDGDGNLVFPEDETVEVTSHCRAESNTTDGLTPVKDGFRLEYNYLIFTNTKLEELPINTRVVVTVVKTGKVFGEGDVVKFESGQRVTRIWLK